MFIISCFSIFYYGIFPTVIKVLARGLAGVLKPEKFFLKKFLYFFFPRIWFFISALLVEEYDRLGELFGERLISFIFLGCV